ncbi:HAMP domain-containing sensor histidine kinase [Anaerolineales bacterium HSG6]|nr:HAMP domain-containing sensor histidine kinase [Anaerolineales bacterium HSG6]MDM8532033.1 HAMP domain-containing sensor histidine kinase [Anaerolineales bacterium HSG25]
MKQLGLRGRVLFVYLLLVMVGLGGLGIRFALLQRQQIIGEAEHHLELEALLLNSVLEKPLEHYLEGKLSRTKLRQLIVNLTKSLDSQITILDISGNPVYDSAVEIDQIPNQFNQTEVQLALQNQVQHDTRFDPVTGVERLYIAILIKEDDEEYLAILQLSVPTDPIWTKIRQAWSVVFGTVATVIVAVVVVSLWLANYILRPIGKLQQAATQIAEGNFEQKIPVTGSDELSDLAKTFNNMASQIKRMIEQQQQFVANASHELRTPLTNIKLRVEALQNGALEDTEVANRFLAQIESETDRMANLTRSLLLLSKLDSGVLNLKTESVDVCAIIKERVEALTPTAQAKNSTIRFDCSPNLPALEINPHQLQQICDNLLGNAIKHSTLNCQIHVSAEQAGQEMVIKFADNGPGIPAEDIPHILERFYQVDKAHTHSHKYSGAGLGLSIVQAIVKQHQGRVDVTSRLNEGTTFMIYLPLG